MARGKKHDNETKEKALAMLATNNNIAELAKVLGIPESTLKTWRKEKEDDEEFAELRREKKAQFVNQAWNIIEDALKLGANRVKRALEHEAELDEIIDVISDDENLSDKMKSNLINKVRTLQIQGIKDISTFIGTLYDKQALAVGDATGRQEVTGKDGGPIKVVFNIPRPSTTEGQNKD